MLKQLIPRDGNVLIIQADWGTRGRNRTRLAHSHDSSFDEFTISASLDVDTDELERLRGKSVDYASDLEYALEILLVSYLTYFPNNVSFLDIKPVSPANFTEAISIVKTSDFMRKRGFLSNFLKKDRKLERKRKYTRLMSKFIEERNKYAHGVFYFLVPQRVWLIQYSDNSGTKQWADVDLATIQSFIDTSFELSDWLVEISRRLDKLKS